MIPTDISLKTKRLSLKKLTKSDIQPIYELFSDSGVTRYWSSSAMTQLSEAETFIKQTEDDFEDERALKWGIVETKSESLIGICTFSSWNKTHKRADIGFALRRDCQGKGFMSEILPGFIRFGFKTLGLHRIDADVDPRNTDSINLLQKLRFKREGYLRETFHLNGEVQDSLIFGLLEKDLR